MTAQATTEGTMYGLSATLTTGTTVIGQIMSVGTAPEMSRKSIKSTHSGSTGGWDTFLQGDIKNAGQLELTCKWNTQLDYATLFESGCDTITVTFPKRAATCGGSVAGTAATFACAVVWEKCSGKWDFEDLALVTLLFTLSGKPTFTAAQT